MLEFILIKDGDTASHVDKDEFTTLVAEYIESGLDKVLGSKSWSQSKKLTKAEIIEITGAALTRALSVVEKISKVRIKP
jgi:hypothetical protein